MHVLRALDIAEIVFEQSTAVGLLVELALQALSIQSSYRQAHSTCYGSLSESRALLAS